MQTMNDNAYQHFSEAAVNQSNLRCVNSELSIRKWHVGRNNVSFENNESHTLSLYLSGGINSFRNDKRDLKGAPGKICLMPQNHQSKWQINDDIDFIHLYFTENYLKQFASLHHNVDVRFVDVKDIVYEDDAQLQRLLLRFFALSKPLQPYSLLYFEEVANSLLCRILNKCTGYQMNPQKVTAGLSVKNIRKIREAILDEIAKPHSIERLAALVNLSPFHFAKMFKLSFGVSPAQYVMQCRLMVVKALLKHEISLMEVGLQAGFCHQSHMSAAFKRHFNLTPLEYRNAL